MATGKLPDLLFFTPPAVPTTSKLWRPGAIAEALESSRDFGVWGSQVIEMPAELHAQFCAKLWPLAVRARKRSCPERVVSMSDAVMYASRRRVLSVPKAVWARLLALVDGAEGKGGEALVLYGWHLLLGQPAVMPHRTMSHH